MKSQIPILIFISLLVGCSSQSERIRKSTEAYIDSKQYTLAINGIDKIVNRNEKNRDYYWALKEGALISIHELKDYRRAIKYLEAISMDSENFTDVIEAQKNKAGIYFNNFQNYPQAIIEYEKLTLIAKSKDDKNEALIFSARSHFYLNQFKDSEIVANTVLKNDPAPEHKFYANQLIGNIKLALRDYQKAEESFLYLLREFPEKSNSDNIFLNLALVYEENNQIDKAVEILKKYADKYTPKEYIELRIKRLLTRKKNMPGAKGLRK